MLIAQSKTRLGALMLLVALPALANDVYRTVDAQGHVTYSDKPLSATSNRMFVDVIPSDPLEAARLAKQQALANAEAAQQSKIAQQQAAEQQRRTAQDAGQARKCEAARSRYNMFAAGGRIFKFDAQGNRVFYSDEEIDAQRINTRAAMDSACAQ